MEPFETNNASKEELINEIISNGRRVSVLYNTIGDLALSIVNTTSASAKEIIHYLRMTEDHLNHTDKDVQWMGVFVEFAGFFLHLMNRQAFLLFGHDVQLKVQRIIFQIVYPSILDYFYADIYENYNDSIKKVILSDLNSAEMEYAKVEFDYTGLILKLSQRLFWIMGYHTVYSEFSETERRIAVVIQLSVYKYITKMKLETLVEDAWKAISTMELGYGSDIFEQISTEVEAIISNERRR